MLAANPPKWQSEFSNLTGSWANLASDGIIRSSVVVRVMVSRPLPGLIPSSSTRVDLYALPTKPNYGVKSSCRSSAVRLLGKSVSASRRNAARPAFFEYTTGRPVAKRNVSHKKTDPCIYACCC